MPPMENWTFRICSLCREAYFTSGLLRDNGMGNLFLYLHSSTGTLFSQTFPIRFGMFHLTANAETCTIMLMP
jgi:hypothetical protein